MPRTPLTRSSAVAGAALLAALVLAPAASAATVSLWHMDETSGTTMHDSVGTNNGTLQAVNLGQPGFLGSSYGFPGRPSIVNVPSSASLNPGAAAFSVTVHINTSVVTRDDSADAIRKGLSTNSKTFWKIELRPSSTRKTEKVRCYFRGTSGTVSLYGPANVADGRWHTITCTKQAGSISITQDGTTRTKAGTAGSISNSAPLTVGAKASNDDAYTGLIDEASFSR
jgi:concanavalin A-like lectin/glucanase superfamily protein